MTREIKVGDLVYHVLQPRRVGSVVDFKIMNDAVYVAVKLGATIPEPWLLKDTRRVDGDQLMADTLAAETTEPPRAEAPPLVIPRYSDSGTVVADELQSLMVLLQLVIGLDFSRGPLVDAPADEQLAEVERVRLAAASELLALVGSPAACRRVHSGR